MSSTGDIGGVLAASALACRRGRRLLFSGVDIALAPGSITWLRGANGVGKTSLMRILAGLTPPEAGRVTWNGTAVRELPSAWRRQLVYIGHANALKEDLTLSEAVAFLARLAGHAGDAVAVSRALEALGIARLAAQPVRTLSQGQRRRGALARLAIDPAPRAWVLDEPHDALDTEGIARLDALITEQAARGGSVLLTSHQTLGIPGMASFDLAAQMAAKA